MNSSAFTVAVKSIVEQFGKTPTEASYLSKPSTIPIRSRDLCFFGADILVASLQVLAMGFGAVFWVRFLSASTHSPPALNISL